MRKKRSKIFSIFFLTAFICLTLLNPALLKAAEDTGSIGILVVDKNYDPISNATIYVDGNQKGRTDSNGNILVRNLTAGKHSLKVDKKGYETTEKSFSISTGQTAQLTITLKEKQLKSATVPGDYSSIQAAIDEVPKGGEVIVKSGEYNENLSVNKGITIEGQEGAIIKGSININQTTSQVTVSGLVIKNGSGVKVKNSSSVNFMDNEIINASGNGILASSSSGTFQNNVIRKAGLNGLLITNSNGLVLSGNAVSSNSSKGLLITQSSATLTDNEINDNGGGGLSASNSNLTIQSNYVIGNGGCGISAGKNSQVSGGENVVVHNSSGQVCDNLTAKTSLQLSAVNVPEDYSKITEAIDRVSSGEVIVLASGTFKTNIVIDKSLKIVGAGQTSIIKAKTKDPTIAIHPDNKVTVELRGLKVINSMKNRESIEVRGNSAVSIVNSTVIAESKSSAGVGIETDKGSVSIVSSKIKGSKIGLLTGGNVAEVKKSRIVNNRLYGIAVRGGEVLVETSVISHNGEGG